MKTQTTTSIADNLESYGDNLTNKVEEKAMTPFNNVLERNRKCEEKLIPIRAKVEKERAVTIEESNVSLRKNQAKAIEENGERVRNQYGKELTDDEVIKVLDFENEMSACKQCDGTTCRKRRGEKLYKVAYYDDKLKSLQIKSSYCSRLTDNKYKLSRIPKQYIGKTFDNYKVDGNNENAVKVAKLLIEHADKGAYFYGGVGTGKTLLAAIIAQEMIRRGREVIFATVPTISARIRSTFNGKEKVTESDILDKLYTVPTLILDDIGIEKTTRFVCSTLCNIFNERYNAQLQTIMTSNYQLEDLEEVFNNPSDAREPTLDGTRILDRCRQMCRPFELKGKSRR